MTETSKFSEILDNIAMDVLNLEPESQPEEFSPLLQKITDFISLLKQAELSEILPLAEQIKEIIEKVIKGELSASDSLKGIGEEISLLQKFFQGGETNTIIKEHEKIIQTLNSKSLPEAKKDEKTVEKAEDKTSDESIIQINLEEDPELYQDFVNEAQEHLNSIEVNIITLEQNPEDKEVINTIFRPFHTIKGIAGFLGLDSINKLAHAAENMFDAARNDQFKITPEAIDVILEVVDLLKNMVDEVAQQLNTGQPTGRTFPVAALIKKIEALRCGASSPEKTPSPQSSSEESVSTPPVQDASAGPSEEGEELQVNFEEDIDLYKDFISETREHLSSIELNILSLEQNPEDKEVINTIFRPFHTIKGVSGFLNLEAINKLSHATESMLDAARNGQFSINEQAIDVILEAVDLIKAMVDDLESQISSGKPTGKKFPVQGLISKIKAISEGATVPSIPKQTEQVSEEKEAVAPQVPKKQEKKKEPPKEPKTPVKEVTKAPREQKVAKPVATIKVDTQKLDNLIDMIGELLITQSMIRQNPVLNDIRDQKLVRDLSQLGRITTELQKTSMSLRMVPIKETFQKMIRLVRDLSKKSGKKVQLIMQGEDTEIDRNMVEELYDPLVHMIRNAVDHGIEMPEERKAKGKPEIGTIELLAYHKGGNIVIEIKDDGQGLDKNKILKKAREKGLTSEEEELSETEIYQLIFKPGFSTAEKVTDVSGRGVGMDVVKKALEKLRGKVEIRSEIEKGTTFIIKLPLTLAIIDGIIVKVGKHRYILPTVAVQEVFRPTHQQYNTYAGKGEMINIRDTLFPLVRLHRLFNVKAKYTEPWKALMVVVESEDEKKCLMVDEVLGKQEVVIKSLGEAMGRVKGIAGGAIMGDGKVGLILDVTGIFEMSEQ
ncbi:MAG: chemotaxis protein CheA [Candidatus Desulfofervidaceae bacterium]|nr:chemotaxis protein CheA [Candidatus Desulfofervidaceae bacterium]